MCELLYPNVFSCSRQKHTPDACVKKTEYTTPFVAPILSLKITDLLYFVMVMCIEHSAIIYLLFNVSIKIKVHWLGFTVANDFLCFVSCCKISKLVLFNIILHTSREQAAISPAFGRQEALIALSQLVGDDAYATQWRKPYMQHVRDCQ